MGKLVGTGTVSGAIGGAAAVLAIAIFARTGTALEPQRAASATPPASNSSPSPQTARPARRLPRGLRRWSITSATFSRSSPRTVSSVTARTSARAACRSPPTATCSTAAKMARWCGRARSARSLMIERVKGTVGDRMPLDELPLSDEQIALLQRWIDQGARATPTSAPAPAPWEAPLALQAPALPAVVWSGMEPACRSARRLVPREVARAAAGARVGCDVRADAPISTSGGCCRRPTICARSSPTRTPDKRDRLVARLLADDKKYAEHWISFWNDLLRNEDGQTYFSEQNGRKSITEWLMASLVGNMPYDQFVAKLLNPGAAGRSRRAS